MCMPFSEWFHMFFGFYTDSYTSNNFTVDSRTSYDNPWDHAPIHSLCKTDDDYDSDVSLP